MFTILYKLPCTDIGPEIWLWNEPILTTVNLTITNRTSRVCNIHKMTVFCSTEQITIVSSDDCNNALHYCRTIYLTETNNTEKQRSSTNSITEMEWGWHKDNVTNIWWPLHKQDTKWCHYVIYSKGQKIRNVRLIWSNSKVSLYKLHLWLHHYDVICPYSKTETDSDALISSDEHFCTCTAHPLILV